MGQCSECRVYNIYTYKKRRLSKKFNSLKTVTTKYSMKTKEKKKSRHESFATLNFNGVILLHALDLKNRHMPL